MLADIFPTGYHATELAGVQPGDQTVIYGAGPVGLMAAYSAIIKGAEQGHGRRPAPGPAAAGRVDRRDPDRRLRRSTRSRR